MNKLDLKSAILIIKDCEEVKSRIDKLITFGNELSQSPLDDVLGFNITRPRKEKIKIDGDEYGESPLKGLMSWSIQFSSGEPKIENETIITESLTVQESLVIVNSLIQINRTKLSAMISKLKEMGVNV